MDGNIFNLEPRKRDVFPAFPAVKGAWDIWDATNGKWLCEGIRGPFFRKSDCIRAIEKITEHYATMQVHGNKGE